MTEDFYDLLGIDRDASQEEIRRAFRDQVREYHPDRNDDPRAPAQFTAIKKAYDTLGDPKEREDYDRMGHGSYCAKRISGLPSPEEWQIPDRDDERAPPTDSGSTAGGSTDERSTRRGDAAPGGRDRRSARNRTANSQSNATGGAASAAAAGSSGGTRRTRSGASGSTGREADPVAALRGVLQWLERVNIGWPLILFSDTLYVVGLSMYLSHTAAGVRRLLDRLTAAATGPESLASVLGSPNGMVPLSEYVVSDVSAGSMVGGVLLILGMAFIPSVYFFIIRETRRIHTPWQPSYLYVLGALGPVTGLILNATLSMPGLYVDLACYVLLPLCSIVGLPFSAFVRPRIVRLVRKTRHSLGG